MSSTFQTSNAEIIGPNGSPFVAKGLNLYDSQMGDASQILADFPGLNFIRLNVYSYQSPSAYAAFIQTMTAKGVVVELEDHTNTAGNAGGGQGTAYTGQQLTNELNWYSSMASAFAANPYVWFGTDNEPPQAGLTQWEQQTYNAIRSAGNQNPIMMELPGGGDPTVSPAGLGMNLSAYTSMTNIIADPHFYGWSSGYSTDQQTVNSALNNLTTGAETIISASGPVPVIIGEYGPATDGQNTDPNASQVLTAVQQGASSGLTSGAVAWGWDTGANDNLTNGSGGLTSYGNEVSNWIAANATPTPTPTPTPAPTPSPNDTVVLAGSTASIIDATGATWTIVNGAADVNGAAAGYSANVAELAYVNGNVWQENTGGLWWEWNGTSWGTGAGTSTSPLPSTPTPTPAPTPTPTPAPAPTPSPNDTVVIAGSGASIIDTSQNVWTIAAGVVDINGAAAGYSANVAELAYVSGAVWQENTAGLWWQWNGTSWGTGAGTATSPLPSGPPTPTPTPTPAPTPTPTPSPAPGITLTDSSGSAVTIGLNTVGSIGADGNTISMVGNGVAVVAVGAGTESIQFVGLSSVILAGGSGTAKASADGGSNTWTAGTGGLTVQGGTGADAYYFHIGDGSLIVSDFAATKGDTLTLDAALKAPLVTASDGAGGTMLTFTGSAGSIDLQHVAALPPIKFS